MKNIDINKKSTNNLLENINSDDLLDINNSAKNSDDLLDINNSAKNSIEINNIKKDSKTQKIDKIFDKNDFYNITSIAFQCIDDEKGYDAIFYEFNDKNAASYFAIVACGSSNRHVCAISDKIVDKIKEKYNIMVRVSGQSTGEWVLIDFFGVMIHIFQPKYRALYKIEKLWNDCGFISKIIDQNLNKIQGYGISEKNGFDYFSENHNDLIEFDDEEYCNDYDIDRIDDENEFNL